MRIPIFLSCPSDWNKEQGRARSRIVTELESAGLEWRSLGKSDYPTMYPLREVLSIAKRCSGGIILGFTQFQSSKGVWKPGTRAETQTTKPVYFPTPWNQLEAGILFSLNLPLLVFAERGVKGGVFDQGGTDVFIHKAPMGPLSKSQAEELRAVILKWGSQVRRHYYGAE